MANRCPQFVAFRSFAENRLGDYTKKFRALKEIVIVQAGGAGCSSKTPLGARALSAALCGNRGECGAAGLA